MWQHHQSPHHPQSNQPHFEAVNGGGSNSRPQLRHKLSYGDLLSSKRQAPVMLQVTFSEKRTKLMPEKKQLG